MKTKKILSIAMLVLALASCSSKDDKKAVEVKEELPIVEITTIGAEAVKQMSEYTGTVEAFGIGQGGGPWDNPWGQT